MSNDYKQAKSLPSGVRLDKILHTGFFCPGEYNADGELDWGAKFYFMGPPGATKTTRLSTFTRRLKSRSGARIPFEGMKPGARGEGQFGVIPVPMMLEVNGKQVQVLDYPPPRFILDKFAGGCGLVLVDELTTTAPALQPALLGLSHEKEIGTYRLPPRVRVFAAGNPVEEAANGYEISLPQANRFIHLPFPDPPVNAVCSYISMGIVPPEEPTIVVEDEEARVLAEWDRVYPAVASSVTGFLFRRPDLLRNQPGPMSPDAARAWASPRTWMYAAQILTAAKIHSCNQAEEDLFIEGTLGAGVCREFQSFRATNDLLDPVAVLDGEAEFAHEASRLDKTFALLTSCAAILSKTPTDEGQIKTREERLGRFIKVMEHAADHNAKDVVVLSLMTLQRSVGHRDAMRSLIMDKVGNLIDIAAGA